MNSHLEKFYFHSPVWAQNLVVTAFGLKLWWERYGGAAKVYERRLQDSERLDTNALRSLQNCLLQETVAHAFAHVPYWRELATRLHLRARDIQKVSDLTRLPLLDKHDLRVHSEHFRADSGALQGGRIFKLHTSGTSGSPLTVWCDPDSRRHHYAFWSRLRRWFGIAPLMSRATFFGRTVLRPDSNRPPFWRHDRFQRNYLFSSYHLAERNLPEYHTALRRLQPEEIIGYPSSLYMLARWLIRERLTDVRPRAVFTTAETLLDYQRATLEAAFGVPVCDQYGCTEMVLFVSQCERGSYHVHPEHGILEVVDADGQPLPPGVEGETVCTGFVNRAMPLLRYRLGDRLVLDDRPCPCGRAFPVVQRIVGRQDDVLVTPDGRPLGRLDPIFKPLEGIVETQIVQTATDHLLVRLVADERFGLQQRAALLYEFRKRTGEAMRIDLERVTAIPKERNGKFRAVVSLLRQERSVS